MPNNVITYKAPSKIEQISSQNFGGVSISSHTFADGKGTVTFASDIHTISENAFQGCTSLTGIKFPECITQIGKGAFSGCSSLVNIVLPAGMTVLSAETFQGCTSLSAVALPEGLESISSKAFDGCTSLVRIEIPKNVTTISEEAFSNTHLSEIKVASGNTKYESPDNSNAVIDKSTSTLVVGTSSTVIPSSVTKIGANAFSGSNIASLAIPESVTSIGSKAFAGCTSLTDITVSWSNPSSVSFTSDILSNTTRTVNLHVPFGKLGAYQSDDKWAVFNLVEMPLPGNMILYTASSKLNRSSIFDIKVVSETYDETTQQGTITCESNIKKVTNVFKKNQKITSLTFPEGVTTISESAFENCTNLVSVTLPEGVTSIGKYAFRNSGIKSLEIPSTVTSIGDMAISSNPSLTSLTVSSDNHVYDSRNNCNAIIAKSKDMLLFSCSTTFIPEGVKAIGRNAFNASKQDTIIIPTSVKSIGYNAFANSALKHVFVSWDEPYEAKSDSNLFEGISPLEKVFLHVPVGTRSQYEANEVWSGLTILAPSQIVTYTTNDGMPLSFDSEPYGEQMSEKIKSNTYANGVGTLIFKEELTTIKEGDFYNCSTLTGITLPEGLIKIENNAFEECSSLTSINIPASVEEVESRSFTTCNSLSSITVSEGNTTYDSRDNCNAIIEKSNNTLIQGCSSTIIPAGVVAIGSGAFCDFSQLTSINIPEGIIRIESEAFSKCTNLTDITVNWEYFNNNIDLADNIFSDISDEVLESITLHVPEGTTELYKNNSIWEKFNIVETILPHNVIYYTATSKVEPREEAFGGLTITESVFENGKGTITFDGEVTTIGNRAFIDRTTLTEITIPKSVATIGEKAFMGCTSLAKIFVPKNVTSIGQDAFSNCTNLVLVTLSEGLTTIGRSAFAYCPNLHNILIPASVTSIGSSVFYSCTGLSCLDIAEDNTVYDGRSHSGTIIETATGKLIAASQYSFIPVGVTTIGESALRGLNFSSVDIPEGVKKIEESAFGRCFNLEEVTVFWTSGIDQISVASDAFESVNLSSVTLRVPEGTKSLYEAANVWKEFNIVEVPQSGDTIYYISTDGYPVSITGSDFGANVKSNKIKSGLGNIAFDGEVTKIGDNIFKENNTLAYIYLPKTVKTIGTEAFEGCNTLIGIRLLNGLETIADNAFSRCGSLASLTIPESVTTIGSAVIDGCLDLTTVSVAEGNTVYDSRDNCNAIIETATNTLVAGCSTTFIPADVTTIGSKAFINNMFTGLEIPEGVTAISDNAFEGCTSLTDIIVNWADPSDVTLGEDIFSGVDVSQITLRVPEGTSEAYLAAEVWKEFNIVESVQSSRIIYYTTTDRKPYPFNKTSYEGLTIVSNEYIGNKGILTLSGDVTKISDKMFYASNPLLTSVTLPEGVTSIGESAFYLQTNLATVKLPKSLTSIGKGAFGYCSALASVTLPENLTTIGDDAFHGCTSFTEVIFPEGVTSIGAKAYEYCTSLTDVTAYWTEPSSIVYGNDIFSNVTVSSVTLHIPHKTKSLYEEIDTWKGFLIAEIRELATSKEESIENLTAIVGDIEVAAITTALNGYISQISEAETIAAVDSIAAAGTEVLTVYVDCYLAGYNHVTNNIPSEGDTGNGVRVILDKGGADRRSIELFNPTRVEFFKR